MAEREQAHRHRRQDRDQRLALITRGIFSVLALAVLGVSFDLVRVGQGLAGLGALVTTLATFAGIYLWGSPSRNRS